MRISDGIAGVAVALVVLGFAPAGGFDGARPVVQSGVTPFEAFRSGTQALRNGETVKAVSSLEYAAELGHAVAQWKLARMYAEGDGVKQDDFRAFQYFSRIANANADENPGAAHARFVANAFVALGNYYLEGIPNSTVQPDLVRARQMFSYAASYFADPDAQYQLGRLYLDGAGTPKDARQAARWLGLAASKGHYQAQATLGAMLFEGKAISRHPARGLMWLTLARDAGGDEKWVADLYDSAFKKATDEDRARALTLLERWLEGRRE